MPAVITSCVTSCVPRYQLGDYSWTSYEDLNTRAEELGRGFRDLGAEPGDKGGTLSSCSYFKR